MEKLSDIEWEYYETRKPFFKILNEICDFNYTVEQERKYGFLGTVNIILKYYISYDEQKLINNFNIIIDKIKKTKAYKKCKNIKEKIDKIKLSPYEYETYFDLKNIINFLLDFSIKHSECSMSFGWDIKNPLSKNEEMLNYFKNKMIKPIMFFNEQNGWERELWQFGFDYPQTEEEIQILKKISNRFDILGEIDQKIGKTSYHVNFIPKEYDEIKWGMGRASYMSSPQFIVGKINISKIREWINLDNDSLFDKLYKGGLKELIRE